jgi:hypothetical protein
LIDTIKVLFFKEKIMDRQFGKNRGQGQKYFHPVIERLGGCRNVARHVGMDASTVTAWAKIGMIPVHHQRSLLELAKKLRVKIGAGDWDARGQDAQA